MQAYRRDYNCNLRVVVVEANPIRRNNLVKRLKPQFSEVYAAEGDGEALLADARQTMLAHFCHVAVVVPDPDNPYALTNDLDYLVQQLDPAGIVLCAARPDDRMAFRAGQRNMEYVRYDDPASDLWAAVEARGRQGCQCHLSVEWPQENFADRLAEQLKMEKGEVTTEHIEDLLGRLFPDAPGVALRQLPMLTTTTLIASAVRRSLVLWAAERHPLGEAQQTPRAIKIGPADEIMREWQNYCRYVDGWLLHNRQARLENHAHVWHVGALTYTFMGLTPHDMVPFRGFYHKRQSREVLGVLRQLFLETCRLWYQAERNVTDDLRLFTLYDDSLHLQTRLEERADTESATVEFPGIPDLLPNPAIWALNMGQQADNYPITTSIIHGDLHGDNFFVDRSRQAWLIDFGQTGPGHALRDFVELEADIKLRLTPFGAEELAALAALDEALLAADRLDKPLVPTPDVTADFRLMKAFEVIAGLRHLAYLTTGVTSAHEYYLALLYETLFMGTLRRLHESVRTRAQLSAALIARRLDALTNRTPNDNGALPRFDPSTIRRSPVEAARAALDAFCRYVENCHNAVTLQAEVYNDSVPAHVQADVDALAQELERARRIRQEL